MLLPVAASTDPGGSAAHPSRRFVELVSAVAPAGTIGQPDHRQPKSDTEGPAVEVASSASGAESHPDVSRRIAQWEPAARAIGHATQAVIGFLRSVGVPQAEAEDIARRIAEAARERVTIDRRATHPHFESGRLSLKLDRIEVSFGRGSGRPEVRIEKAEIGIDIDIPGARHEDTGAQIGHTEAEIGGRHVAFDYNGPGATTPFADRGASGLTFDAAAPVAPETVVKPPPPTGHVDVAI
jgi:hypothetical protein